MPNNLYHDFERTCGCIEPGAHATLEEEIAFRLLHMRQEPRTPDKVTFVFTYSILYF